MTRRSFKIDSFRAVNEYLKVVRYTVINSWLRSIEPVMWSIETVNTTPIVSEQYDIEKVKSELVERLRQSNSPCVREAYAHLIGGLDGSDT